MSRELSSAYTPVYRWVIPGLLTVAAVATIWWLAIPAQGSRPHVGMVFLALILALAMMVLARFFDRAKRVWCEPDGVRISDYRRETRVKWCDISRVEATRFGGPHRVRLVFGRPTVFGDSVVFFPPAVWFGGAEPSCVAMLSRFISESADAKNHSLSA